MSLSRCCWWRCERCWLDLWAVSPLPPLHKPVWHVSKHTSGGKTAVCAWACVCHLNVLPFIDLKTHCFCVPAKPHVEVAAQLVRSLHLSTVLFFPSTFLLFGCVISLYWVTRFPRVTEGTCCSPLDFFTSWTERNFPWYRVKTASCHSHLALIKDRNQGREKVCNLVKVKRHVTEESR